MRQGGATWQLWDEKTDLGLNVDDPAKLRPLTGKKVKVTGTLDAKTNTIKVESVEAVKGS